MIKQYGTPERPIYLATTKAERRKLIKEGQIVYSEEEFNLANSVPAIKTLADIINSLKIEFPEITIIGVRSVSK